MRWSFAKFVVTFACLLLSLMLFALSGTAAGSSSAAAFLAEIGAMDALQVVQQAALFAQTQFVPEPTPHRPNGPPPTPIPPADVGSLGVIASTSEPGDPLVVSGHVYGPDGVTPAAGVLVYAYQTDATGEYHNDPATHVARLHGWAKTDSQGAFEFRTIKPGPYPGRLIPAHIHFHAWGGGYPLQWTPDLNFAGDPLLKPSDLDKSSAAGEFGSVQQTTRGPDGMLHCTFNMRLSSTTNYK